MSALQFKNTTRRVTRTELIKRAEVNISPAQIRKAVKNYIRNEYGVNESFEITVMTPQNLDAFKVEIIEVLPDEDASVEETPPEKLKVKHTSADDDAF